MKKIAVSLLATATLGMGIGIGAYAQSNIETIQAFINHEIKFTLNGQTWAPKDPDGKQLSPIIYEGSSYVPLRAVGEVSGLKVNWNDATKTIELQGAGSVPSDGTPYKDSQNYGNKTGKPSSNDSELQLPSASNDSETTYSTFNVHTDTSTAAYKADQEESARRSGIALTDLKYERIIGTNVLKRVNIDASFRDEKLHPLLRDGVEYARGISAMLDSNATSQKIVYNLDGKYAAFNTHYDVDDYTKNSPEKPQIKFYVDGKLIATGGVYVGSDQFVFFDVTGVKKLEISFEVASPRYAAVAALYAPRLYKNR
jgi:hypothetical protein